MFIYTVITLRDCHVVSKMALFWYLTNILKCISFDFKVKIHRLWSHASNQWSVRLILISEIRGRGRPIFKNLRANTGYFKFLRTPAAGALLRTVRTKGWSNVWPSHKLWKWMRPRCYEKGNCCRNGPFPVKKRKVTNSIIFSLLSEQLYIATSWQMTFSSLGRYIFSSLSKSRINYAETLSKASMSEHTNFSPNVSDLKFWALKSYFRHLLLN